MRVAGRLCWIGLWALAAGAPLRAQEPRAAVVGDTIRVGDVVPVAVRVPLEPGQRVAWPDTLPLEGEPDLENAARVRERVDTLEDGTLQVTAVYSITPWRPGELALPELELRVISGDEGARTLVAELPALQVASVLPEDTAGIQPRPLKDVIGRNWAWLPLLLLLLAVLAVIGLLVWWLRRRRAAEPAALQPDVPPRERALEALRRARDSGALDRGEWTPFYSAVAAALRHYAAAQTGDWGEDLTTSELVARIRATAGNDAAAPLRRVLRAADQVKFARHTPDRPAALEDWEAARAWVESFAWPPPAREPAEPVEEAA